MMKLTPDHSVIYHGVLHNAGETFTIDSSDSEKMKKYGKISGKSEEETEKIKGSASRTRKSS